MVNIITWMKTNLWKTVYSHVDGPTLHIQAAPKGILFWFFLLKKTQEVEKESVVLRSEQERRELDLIKLDYIHIINHQMIKSKSSFWHAHWFYSLCTYNSEKLVPLLQRKHHFFEHSYLHLWNWDHNAYLIFFMDFCQEWWKLEKLLKIESLIFLLLLYPSFMCHQNLLGPCIGEYGSDKFKQRK